VADSRYRLQAIAQAAEARIEATTYDLAAIWPTLLAVSGQDGSRRSALVNHQLWQQLQLAAPDVELV